MDMKRILDPRSRAFAKYLLSTEAAMLETPQLYDMVYLSPEGHKVANPNDKRIEAEIKNRGEAIHLQFYKNLIEKQKFRRAFHVKMAQRDVLVGLRGTMETSGQSEEGRPPVNASDREHEKSPYFSGRWRMSERRLVRWRADEKELQRVLVQRGDRKPPWEANEDIKNHDDFVQMLEALGFVEEDGEVRLNESSRVAKRRSTPALLGQDGGPSALASTPVEPSPNPQTPFAQASTLDVFQCLREKGALSPLESSQGDIPGKDTDQGQLSIGQWERSLIEDYIGRVSRPCSATVTKATRRQRSKTKDPVTCPKDNRPKSAPGKLTYSFKRKVSNETAVCERCAQRQVRTSWRPHTGLRAKPPKVAPSRSYSAAPVRGKNLPANVSRLEVKSHTIIPDKTELSANGSREKTDREETEPKREPKVGLCLSHAESGKNVHKTKISTNKHPGSKPSGRPGSKTLKLPHPKSTPRIDLQLTQDKAIPDDRSSTTQSSQQIRQWESVMSDDDSDQGESVVDVDGLPGPSLSQVTHWRRDLLVEAPPRLFSRRGQLRFDIAVSKEERKRELEQMVKGNTCEKGILSATERMRQAYGRMKALVTLKTVKEAATKGGYDQSSPP